LCKHSRGGLTSLSKRDATTKQYKWLLFGGIYEISKEFMWLSLHNHKNPIKDWWLEPSRGDKKGRPKKGQKTNSPHEPKKGEN